MRGAGLEWLHAVQFHLCDILRLGDAMESGRGLVTAEACGCGEVCYTQLLGESGGNAAVLTIDCGCDYRISCVFQNSERHAGEKSLFLIYLNDSSGHLT